GCTSGANPFLEGAANGGGKALRVRGFSGNTAQGFLNCLPSSCRPENTWRPSRRPAICPLPCLLFLLVLGSALLCGCGHKRTPAPVPPPPSLPQQKEKPAATPPAETAGGNEKKEGPPGATPTFEQNRE